jgi:glycosyltransferase involved in cell wall biosynthesis
VSSLSTRPSVRILAVLEAGDLYPSGFVRGLIYKSRFESDGHDIEFVSRLWLPLARLRQRSPRWLRILLCVPFAEQMMTRLAEFANRRQEHLVVRRARDRDVVYMSKVTSPRLVHALRENTGARVVLDFGDAIWLPRYRIERVDELLRGAHAITTDNDWTAAYARKFNPRCTVIPDAPQVEWFDRARAGVAKPSASQRFVLGWVGTASTAYNLYVVWEALEELFQRHAHLHLRIVGAAPPDLPPFERVVYSCAPSYDQPGMIHEVLQMHVGLFPLQDVEACRVRGVLKATVYMSGEAVAVCSPVGQARELIDDGVNGMLAAGTREWIEKIEALISDDALRRKIAANALHMVRDKFSVDRSYQLLSQVLAPITGGGA